MSWVTPEQKPRSSMPSIGALLGIGLVVLVLIWMANRTEGVSTPERTLPPVVALEDQMHVVVTDCFSDKARGTVHNGSSQTVSVFLDVQFLDSSGHLIDNGIDSASHLRPGETAQWEANMLEEGTVARCRADVDSVYAD